MIIKINEINHTFLKQINSLNYYLKIVFKKFDKLVEENGEIKKKIKSEEEQCLD